MRASLKLGHKRLKGKKAQGRGETSGLVPDMMSLSFAKNLVQIPGMIAYNFKKDECRFKLHFSPMVRKILFGPEQRITNLQKLKKCHTHLAAAVVVLCCCCFCLSWWWYNHEN